MRTLIRQSARLLVWFASATLVVIMGITFIDVIGRTFFGRFLARVINLVLAVGIAGLLTRQLIVKTGEILAEQEHTQILELPYWPTAVLMSAGMTLFVVILLLRLLEEFTDPAKQ